MQAIQRLLPISQPALQPAAGDANPCRPPADTPVIFVVDDDSHVREGIRSLLEADGRTVEDFATCEASSKPTIEVAKDVSWWMPICRG